VGLQSVDRETKERAKRYVYLYVYTCIQIHYIHKHICTYIYTWDYSQLIGRLRRGPKGIYTPIFMHTFVCFYVYGYIVIYIYMYIYINMGLKSVDRETKERDKRYIYIYIYIDF
jgi:hypothetical protein